MSKILGRLVVGLDPGTGKTSPAGLACFDPATRSIIYTNNITSSHESDVRRVRDISEQIELDLESLSENFDLEIYIECFVMRGKGGEKLARLTGGLFRAIPYYCDSDLVFNTTVKKVVAGHGHADKFEVAKGVLQFFDRNSEARKHVSALIDQKEWDQLDALAIGITGYLVNES